MTTSGRYQVRYGWQNINGSRKSAGARRGSWPKRNRQIQDLEKARFGSRPSEANVWIDSGSRKGSDQDRVLRTSADGFWTRFGSRPNAICKQGGPLGEPLWRACDGPRCFSAPGARLRLRRVRAAPPLTPRATRSPKARGAPVGCEALPQRTRHSPQGARRSPRAHRAAAACGALPQGARRSRRVRGASQQGAGRHFPAGCWAPPSRALGAPSRVLSAPHQGVGRSLTQLCAGR